MVSELGSPTNADWDLENLTSRTMRTIVATPTTPKATASPIIVAVTLFEQAAVESSHEYPVAQRHCSWSPTLMFSPVDPTISPHFSTKSLHTKLIVADSIINLFVKEEKFVQTIKAYRPVYVMLKGNLPEVEGIE